MLTTRPLTLFITLFITPVLPVVAAVQPSGMTITRILEAVGAREGLTVCEIGAGDGALSLAAARVVGAAGRVYTNELGAARVQALQEKVSASALTQITVVSAIQCARILPRWCAALKPGGRLAIIDFTPPGREAPRPADRGNDGMHGITPETLSRELKEAGFAAASSEDGAERWFMIVAVKPKC